MTKRRHVPSSQRVRALLWSAVIVLGCDGTTSLPVIERSSSDAAPSYSCGTIRPNVSVFCKEGIPVTETTLQDRDEHPLPEGQPYTVQEAIPKCDLGHTPGDTGKTIEADLSVMCSGTTTDDAVTLQATFDGYATRRCAPGQYGSGAVVRPYWSATLTFPGDGARYHVDVTAQVPATDVAGSCVLWIGDREADLLHGSNVPAPVLTAELDAGTYDVALDCTIGTEEGGLASTTCVGFTKGSIVSTPEVTAHVAITIEAHRCAPSGC